MGPTQLVRGVTMPRTSCMATRLEAVGNSIHDRVQFETLISDISARLVARTTNIDDALVDGLHEVRTFFRADRCGLLTVDADRQTVHNTHYALGSSVPAMPTGVDLLTLFPWVGARLLADREPVAVVRLDDLPPEASRDREQLEQLPIRSLLVVPIAIGSAVSRLIALSTYAEEREWPPAFIPRLRVLGELMANAVHRAEAFEALQRSDERMNRAAAAGQCGLWDYDPTTGHFWVTAETRRIYGLTADEPANFDRFVSLVAAADRDRVTTSVTQCLDAQQRFDSTYRIMRGDGVTRWIHAVGTPDQSGRLLGVSVDVTVTVLAEQQQRDQSARLAAAVDAAGFGFSDFRLSDGQTFVDDRLQELFGLEPGTGHDLAGAWFARIEDDYRERIRADWDRVLAGEIDRVTLEYPFRHPTRGRLWLRHVLVHLSGSHLADSRVIGAVQDVTERRSREVALQAAHDELKRLRDLVERENVYLRKQVARAAPADLVVGHSAAIRRALAMADQVATTASTVLLMGETGTGKERFAEHIHQASPRSARHMVRVNCSAIPSALMESELFGREKGAYTGALSKQIGRFELAHESTLFLDEIGDLPMDMQVKLLRVLQERTIERLGSPRPVSVDVRIIAATNRDLEADVRAGRFRSDLYYRLNVFPIVVPPLRERREDIPDLVEMLVRDVGESIRKHVDSVDPESLHALAEYDWPGNVRELRNVLERAMILSSGRRLIVERPQSSRPASSPADLTASAAGSGGGRSLQAIEREQIVRVLGETGWRIRGQGGAAEILGLKPTTLEGRMRRLGIRRPVSSGTP